MNQRAQTAGTSPLGAKDRGRSTPSQPFQGLIDAVLIAPGQFSFEGAVGADSAAACWTWVVRDLCPDLISAEGVANGNFGSADLELVVPEILLRVKSALDASGSDGEALRRLRAQLGRDDALEAAKKTMTALRHRALLAKAQSFGKALNAITEEQALTVALQSMPLQEPKVAALLFQAALGHVANPTRLILAAIKLSGNASEVAVQRQGFGPLIEACLAHAQDQLSHLDLNGPFADVDRACRSLDRFHRLVRALTGYIEFARTSRSTHILATITKQVSDRVEPRLREVVTDINQAMRRPREAPDRVDMDRLLGAINGVYLLATVRDCRDSLALNAIFDQAWNQSGQALEIHIQRNLELLRQAPEDEATGTRLDAAIKMAEVRFNGEYADTLRRARAAAGRRA